MSYPFRTHAAALASGLAVASTVASASAQLTGTEVESYAAAALYVTYAFGAKQGVGLGFEGRVGARELEIEQCDVDANEAFPYGGGALRLEWFPASHTRLLIVGQAGHTFATIMGAHGELGVGYRWGERAGFDTVLGAELDLSVTAFGLHFDVMRPELSGSAGFVIPPVWLRPNSCWVAGRPQRAEHGYAPLPALALSGTTRNNAPPEVARIWCPRFESSPISSVRSKLRRRSCRAATTRSRTRSATRCSPAVIAPTSAAAALP